MVNTTKIDKEFFTGLKFKGLKFKSRAAALRRIHLNSFPNETEEDYKKRFIDQIMKKSEKERDVEIPRIRNLRHTNEKTGLFEQNTTVKKGEDFKTICDNRTVQILNKNLPIELQKANKLLEEFNIVQTKLVLAYYIPPTDVKLSGNPLWHYDINESKFTPNDIKIMKENKSNKNIVIKTFKIDPNNFSLDSIYLELNNKLASIGAIFVVTGYQILVSLQHDLKFSDYVNDLKAFAPTTNQQFHKETSCSTTKSRKCIYQSYYYLYVEQIMISKNEKKIEESLENESEEVKDFVKNGELGNFLTYMANKLNETMLVELFNHPSKIGFSVSPNGEINEITNQTDLIGKKVFSYVDMHVAPKIIINDSKKFSTSMRLLNKEKTKTYSLKPSPVKKLNQQIEVHGYDIETYNDEDCKAVPYCICISNGINYYGNDVVIEFCDYLDNIKTEVDTSSSHQHNQIKQILFYGFNNSRFDNIFIYNELLNRNPSTKYTIDNNSVKYIKYHNIRIYDLSLYYSGSLDSVSESFKLNIHKSVFPYSFPNENNLDYEGQVPESSFWKKEDDMEKYLKENGNTFNLKDYTIKYCLLDAKLVEKIALKHLDESKGMMTYSMNGRSITKSFDVRTSPTAGGMAVKLFSQIFQKDTLYASPPNIQKIERLAYKGGRTEVFKKSFNKTKDYLRYYDINSSYPFAMTYLMPFKFIRSFNFNEKKLEGKLMNNLFDHYLYLSKSSYTGNCKSFIPNLLVRSEEGDVIATNDTEYSYHWGIELREAINNDCDVWIKEIHEYEGKYIFKEFIEYMYNERLKVKLSNPSKSNFFKLLMNSLCGKFGQSIKAHNKICSSLEEVSLIANDLKCKIVDFEKIGDKILLKYNVIGDENNSIGNLIRFASYITAIARTNLSIFMREVGHEHVYYCDTDSVFTDSIPPEYLLDQTKLGSWKQETCKQQMNDGSKKEVLVNITDAIFLAPKTYRYTVEKIINSTSDYTSMKAKGQPSHKLKKEHYDEATNGECVEIVNDSMFFRNLEEIHIKPQTRTLQSVYNKRIWINNDSIPYKNYNDWHENKYTRAADEN